LVLGIIGIVLGGWLFGLIGMYFAKESDRKQAEAGLPPLGTAKAGRITSIIAIAYGALMSLIVIAALFIPFMIGFMSAF